MNSDRSKGQERHLPLAHSLDEIQPLLRMCREGRVYDFEQWIAEGKPVQVVPAEKPRGCHMVTAMEIALDTDKYSTVDHGSLVSAYYRPLFANVPSVTLIIAE